MRDLRRELEGLPQDPSSHSHLRHVAFRAKRALDFVGHARPDHARFFRRLNPYPKPWKHVTFRTEDGVQIAGWLADSKRDDPPFGIVLVPGMFGTKDDTAHKGRAIRIHRHWDIPIIVIDQRAFGESTGIATAGWKEAYDITGAAALLRERTGIERIGIISESMGGAATLNALAHDARGGTNFFTGGVTTWSAFVDARDAVHYITAEPPKDHPFYAAWASFRRLLRFRSMGGYHSFEDYLEDAARVNGLEDIEELFDLANPKWKVAMIHQPVLVVHSTDDPVVPVRHARRMDRYARDHDNIQVLITNWGGHTAFEALDPWWYWEVNRRFFGAINDCTLPNIATPKGRDPKLDRSAKLASK